ncbi:MAG: NAD-dependent epimerase/dehydratase family protein [Desulfobacteraceae bacterium]|nr:MAG: NAD-dependent epimerase/dehydratase family protein [Desulfobacteraceae bacterium]
MNNEKPGILVTGASGFIGRHFVIAVSEHFRLFCIARRSQKEAGVPHSDNISWIQADITKMENLLSAANHIKENGGVDYVLHLAGYYDFTMDDNPAYENTNVGGTLNILKMSQQLEVKHFIFSSSLAACKFPPRGKSLTETSPTDADFPYARSKGRSEWVIRKHAGALSCSIVRLAAVYSDWCENPPLNMILKKWLTGNKLISRALPGKGASAMPYIHIKDLNKMFLRIIEISDQLSGINTFIASPQGSVSHMELFKTATKYYYGREIEPLLVPKPLASASLAVWQFWNGLTGKASLEQPWMADYIDKKLNVDASVTYRTTGWQPSPRYHILRRMLFLTENMKNHPNNWAFRNESLLKRFATRKSTLIYDIMMEERRAAIDRIADEITAAENISRFPHYSQMDPDLLKWDIHLHYQMLAATVKSRDRSLVQNFAQIIATHKYMEGFNAAEVKNFVITIGKAVKKILVAKPQLQEHGRRQSRRIDDLIILTIQFAVDEVEDTFEILKASPPDHMTENKPVESIERSEPVRRMIRRLEDICGDSMMMPVKNHMRNLQ